MLTLGFPTIWKKIVKRCKLRPAGRKASAHKLRLEPALRKAGLVVGSGINRDDGIAQQSSSLPCRTGGTRLCELQELEPLDASLIGCAVLTQSSSDGRLISTWCSSSRMNASPVGQDDKQLDGGGY